MTETCNFVAFGTTRTEGGSHCIFFETESFSAFRAHDEGDEAVAGFGLFRGEVCGGELELCGASSNSVVTMAASLTICRHYHVKVFLISHVTNGCQGQNLQ